MTECGMKCDRRRLLSSLLLASPLFLSSASKHAIQGFFGCLQRDIPSSELRITLCVLGSVTTGAFLASKAAEHTTALATALTPGLAFLLFVLPSVFFRFSFLSSPLFNRLLSHMLSALFFWLFWTLLKFEIESFSAFLLLYSSPFSSCVSRLLLLFSSCLFFPSIRVCCSSNRGCRFERPR